jgi:hypothetical protein
LLESFLIAGRQMIRPWLIDDSCTEWLHERPQSNQSPTS